MSVPTYTIPGSAQLFTVTAHLGGSDISALNSSPVTLVAAPGAGVAVIPVELDLEYVDGGTGFTTTNMLQLYWNSISDSNIAAPGGNGWSTAIFGTHPTHTALCVTISLSVQNTSIISNQPLILGLRTSNPTADGDLYVTLTYRLVPLN